MEIEGRRKGGREREDIMEEWTWGERETEETRRERREKE